MSLTTLAWRRAPLAEVATLDRAARTASDLPPDTPYVGLEHVDSDGTFRRLPSVGETELSSGKFAFDSRHVLYGKLRPYLSKIATPDFAGVCSTEIIPIRPRPFLDRAFLRHFLRQPPIVAWATTRSSGANLPRISPRELAQLPIAFPPLAEQRRIADILDKADAIRRKRKEAIALTDELLRSAFLEMFGDPVTNPKGWPVKALERLATVNSGVTKGKKHPAGTKLVAVPYMRVANVQDGFLNLTEIKHIEVRPDDVKKYALRDGDLLLTEGGDPDKLGRGTVWRGEVADCIHQNHIFSVRLNPDSQLAPDYLSTLLGSARGKRYFLRAGKQTTGIASINKTQLRGFPCLLPPLPLQVAYAGMVARVTSLRQTTERQALADNALFNSLVQRAFRGEL